MIKFFEKASKIFPLSGIHTMLRKERGSSVHSDPFVREIRRYEQDDELELVQMAKEGDAEAFNELVRRHRPKALGFARSFARDAHLAEDIVQDALVRAFIRLNQLTDIKRFVPWLQRIIRNQAYIRLRRGGPFGKERPFSAMVNERLDRESEWSNPDPIAQMMSRRTGQGQTGDSDPQAVA